MMFDPVVVDGYYEHKNGWDGGCTVLEVSRNGKFVTLRHDDKTISRIKLLTFLSRFEYKGEK